MHLFWKHISALLVNRSEVIELAYGKLTSRYNQPLRLSENGYQIKGGWSRKRHVEASAVELQFGENIPFQLLADKHQMYTIPRFFYLLR